MGDLRHEKLVIAIEVAAAVMKCRSAGLPTIRHSSNESPGNQTLERIDTLDSRPRSNSLVFLVHVVVGNQVVMLRRRPHR
jgi:hypothetical protein